MHYEVPDIHTRYVYEYLDFDLFVVCFLNSPRGSHSNHFMVFMHEQDRFDLFHAFFYNNSEAAAVAITATVTNIRAV